MIPIDTNQLWSTKSKTLVRSNSKYSALATVKKSKTPHQALNILSCFSTNSKQLTLKSKAYNQQLFTTTKATKMTEDPVARVFNEVTEANEVSSSASENNKKTEESFLLSIGDEDRPSSRIWKKEDFQFISKLGKGKFGHVYSAREKQSGYVVAIKQMRKQELQENNFVEQVKRQIQIQSYLRHENILRLFGFFWDDDCIYLILEYAPGCELYKQIRTKKRLPEWRAACIVKQVIQGIKYLHSRGIIHRDIKPQNILVCFDKIKIADFGWSAYCESEAKKTEDQAQRKKRETMCGTLDYLAPEMVKGALYDGSVDIWAIGVLSYELVVGFPPFETASYQQTYERICFEGVKFPTTVSKYLTNFVQCILVKNPEKRMSLGQALRHPWITQYSQHSLVQ